MNNSNKSPILFIIFNRPETTVRVFDQIKAYKPEILYIASDGPRIDKISDFEKCRQTREIINLIDWPCKIFKNFSEKNLGCKRRISSAIDWFFENEEYGIILEDDCVPDQSFFYFCAELLEKYKNNIEVGIISGNNFQFNKIQNEYSYYFSKYPHIWGWATWRRVWQKYDVTINSWPEIKRSSAFKEAIGGWKEYMYWSSIFNEVYENKIDTWDYQLAYMFLVNNLCAIMPTVNLVTNIGFHPTESTHTRRKSKFANMLISPMIFPLIHPPRIVIDTERDKITKKNIRPFWKYCFKKILVLLKIKKYVITLLNIK